MKSFWMLLVLATVACSSTSRNLTNLTPEAWEFEVRSRGVDPREAPNPLTITETMRNEAVRIAGYGGVLERLKQLQISLFDSDTFPFSYASRVTLTAAEAFHRREGNCLSFTNLFVAIGQVHGGPGHDGPRPAVPGEREGRRPDRRQQPRDRRLPYGGGTKYYDFDRTREQRPADIKVLDDMWITALYLNNRGADELRAGHPEVRRPTLRQRRPAGAGVRPRLGQPGRRAAAGERHSRGIPGVRARARHRAGQSDGPDQPRGPVSLDRARAEAQIALKAGRGVGSVPSCPPDAGRPRALPGQARGGAGVLPARPAFELAPAGCMDRHGQGEVCTGKDSIAVRYAKKALRLDPNAAEARALLERIASARLAGSRPASVPN